MFYWGYSRWLSPDPILHYHIEKPILVQLCSIKNVQSPWCQVQVCGCHLIGRPQFRQHPLLSELITVHTLWVQVYSIMLLLLTEKWHFPRKKPCKIKSPASAIYNKENGIVFAKPGGERVFLGHRWRHLMLWTKSILKHSIIQSHFAQYLKNPFHSTIELKYIISNKLPS